MFQNLLQYMAYPTVDVCTNVLVCSDLLWELVLFLSGTVLGVAAVYGCMNTGNCNIRVLSMSMHKI